MFDPRTKTTLPLFDDELAVLVIHRLLMGAITGVADHDAMRQKAAEVMDWLQEAELFSAEEAGGWEYLKSGQRKALPWPQSEER